MNNNFKISKYDVSDNVLVIADDFIEKKIIQSDDKNIEQIVFLLKDKPSFLNLLFPTKSSRAIQKMTSDKMRNLFLEKEEDLFRVHSEIQLERLRIASDKMIQKSNSINRKKLIEYYQNSINDMSIVMMKSRSAFSDKRIENLKDLEKYKDHPILYKNYKKTLNDQLELFFSNIDILLNQFMKEIKKSVQITNDKIELVIDKPALVEFDEEIINFLINMTDTMTEKIKYMNNKMSDMTEYFNKKIQ